MEIKKKKVYYAHSMIFYGSQIEANDIETLEKMGFEVINPNNINNEQEYIRTGDFNVFLDLVAQCEILAFRSVINKITTGVANEIEFAKGLGLHIIEMPTITQDRILTIEETRQYFRPLNIVFNGSKKV